MLFIVSDKSSPVAFVADLRKLFEQGSLLLGTEPQAGPSHDLAVGNLYKIDHYKLIHSEGGWLQENSRTLMADFTYVGFTKGPAIVRDSYEARVAPRSSFARMGLEAVPFAEHQLSRLVEARKLPASRGRMPLVLRSLRTNVALPEGCPPLQLFVCEKGTVPLSAPQLAEACRQGSVRVTRSSRPVEPEENSIPLTFGRTILRYQPSGHVFDPYEDSERHFSEFDIRKGFELLENCFHLGSTAEEVCIGTQCFGTMTYSYPRSWWKVASGKRGGKRHRRAANEQGDGDAGYVHLTPWIKPGSRGTQTLEIVAKTYGIQRIEIRAGDYACSLQVFAMDGECQPYRGRYAHQQGPVTGLVRR